MTTDEVKCDRCGSVLADGWQHTQLCRTPEEIASQPPKVDLWQQVQDLTAQLAACRAALREACDIASSNIGRCSHLSDFVGRGALVDTATCNNLMPCPAHGEFPRIAQLRQIADDGE